MGELTIQWLEAGRWQRKEMKKAFAAMREMGAIVTWAEVDEGFWSTTWYNVKITGETAVIKKIQAWLAEMVDTKGQ